MDLAIMIGRLIYGGFFINAGLDHLRHRAMMMPYAAAKGVPAPTAAVVLTGVQLLAGGLSIVLGLWPRVGLVLIALFLLPTSFMMHAYWKVPDPAGRTMDRVQFLKNMALLGATLMLFAVPEPWRWSLGR
jgi:putative oxidoreductase